MSDAILYNRVNVYYCPRDTAQYIAPHFQVGEFRCADGNPVVLIHELLPAVCEDVRLINGPYSPNSAYRTVAHNTRVGGAANSYHLLGMAVDIPARNATAEEIYTYLDSKYPENMEIGIYNGYVHFAVCPAHKRFDKR